jgi:hypothetical protein
MSQCVKKLFNKKREKLFEKEFEEQKKKLDLFIKTYPNSPGIKNFKKTLKNMNLKKSKKKRMDDYRKTMCNPTCKNTVFESGDPNKLTSSFIKQLKKEPNAKKNGLVDYQLSIRKEIFGKEDNVLKDGFYKVLDAETVKNLKKNGATSGCYRGGLTAFHLIRPLL